MSKGQSIIIGSKKVHFQEANVNSAIFDQYPAQVEFEKLSHIPYGTIHLGRNQKSEQAAGFSQSFPHQSQWQSSVGKTTAKSGKPFFGPRRQNQLLSLVKKPVSSQKTSNILAALGLSSKDLDEVKSYPKDKLTLDSLPKILKQIKKKRAPFKHNKDDNSPQQSQSTRTSLDDAFEEKLKNSCQSQGNVLKPLVNYGYDPSSGESSSGSEQGGKSGSGFRKKERHFTESPNYRSKFDSDSETESDYEIVELPFPCEEESLLESKRKTPILQNIKDFLGHLPVVLPHCCSLCDKVIDTLQDWNDHMKDSLHKLRCLLLQRVYPDWTPGELPVAKNNLVEMPTTSVVVLKKKVKIKRSPAIPEPSKPENPKESSSRVVVINNLPSSGFSDFDTVRLGCAFGKVIKYLKVGEKAFLKMDSKIATNNLIEHFKRKPLFYGRLLTVSLSSAQIQPLLKKPSAKIEEMLKKVNQADSGTKESFLDPIMKYKSGDLKKSSISEREKKSSESSETAESKSSDESGESAEWRKRTRPRNSARMLRRTREYIEQRIRRRNRDRRARRASRERAMQKGDRERGGRWGSRERGGRRDRNGRERRRASRDRYERRGSHERAERRGSRERGGRRGSRERRLQGAKGEKRKRDGSRQRAERRGSSDRGGSSDREDSSDREGSSERIIWGDSSEGGELDGSSERRERGGSSERIIWGDSREGMEWGDSNERIAWGDSSERIEWGDSSERIVWGDSNEKIVWGDSRKKSEWGDSSEKIEWGDSSEKIEWGDSSERTEREKIENLEREWKKFASSDSAVWENFKSCISEDRVKHEINNDVELKFEDLFRETTIPFLESDSELQTLMEKSDSEDDIILENIQNESKDEMKETDTRTDAKMLRQEMVPVKTHREIGSQKETGPENRMVLLDNLPPVSYPNIAIGKLGAKFGKVQNYPAVKPVSQNTKEEPGQVVHIADLVPGNCTKNDLIHLAELFGKINNIFLIKAKGEGFVELSKSTEAQAMVKFYQAKPPVIQGNIIRVEMCQKYKKLNVKFPDWDPTAGGMPPFAAPLYRQCGVQQNTSAPEEDIFAPSCTPNLAELRAKYSQQLLRWTKVPFKGKMPLKNKSWVPQTHEGKELECFSLLPYAFKVPLLENHERQLRGLTGTPDKYELDTPKIDSAFVQLLIGKKTIHSREDLDKKLGEPEKVLCKAQSKIGEIVGPLLVAIQNYELDKLSGELDSLTTEQLKKRLQSTVISCHQSILCAGQTHCWLTNLRAENLLQLFKFKTPVKPQDYPNMTTSDLLGAEAAEEIIKKGEVLKHVTPAPGVKKMPPVNIYKKKKVFQSQYRKLQPYYCNPHAFRGRGRPFRGHPRGHPIFKNIFMP